MQSNSLQLVVIYFVMTEIFTILWNAS